MDDGPERADRLAWERGALIHTQREAEASAFVDYANGGAQGRVKLRRDREDVILRDTGVCRVIMAAASARPLGALNCGVLWCVRM